MIDAKKIQFLNGKARQIRRQILTMVHRANSGHVGGSLGAADIVVALYYEAMRHNPKNPRWPERDRFILSKGHCAPVLYATLADCGYFAEEDLEGFRRPGSHLQGHPNHTKTPGLDASTGTLGLGLSTAAGMALGAKMHGQSQYYYTLCGDGELQEGQIWEAALFCNKYKLDNLIGFIDRNYLQTDGNSEDVMPLDPLLPKWQAFGWNAFEIDGNDIAQILDAISQAKNTRGRPTMIVARTVKGKGVPFMENVASWHGTPPNDGEYNMAMEALADGI